MTGSRADVFRALSHNRSVLRIVTAYAAFTVCEFGLWIAMMVYSYDQGGATTAGLVAVVQLVPAAGVALLVAPLAERTSPATVLTGGYVLLGLAAAGTAALLLSGADPLAVYAGAASASGAMATTRPSQSALLPGLASHAAQLTACNVAIGWVENLGVLVSGVAVGVALTFGSVGHAYAGAAALMVVALVLVLPLRSLPVTRRARPASPPPAADAVAASTRGPARLLLGLLALEHLVVGALDLLFVVMAVDVLAAGEAWAGYLNTAYGAGAVLLGMLGALLVGRRLGPVVAGSAAVLGLALAATSVVGLAAVAVLLAVVGGARTLFDMSVRVLLQRSVPPERLVRLFGVSEGLNMLSLGTGALVVPLLVWAGGPTLALIGTAALLPLVALARLALLLRIDQQARLPVVEISLLQQIPLFRALPSTTIEALAQALEQVDLPAGTVIMAEGDVGDSYVAVAEGSVEIRQHDKVIATLGRGEGLGEIALLRSTPRTATAVATSRVTAFRLDRDSFLHAVLGHAPTHESADAVVRAHTDRDAARESGQAAQLRPDEF
jgi:hypothetical protein